MTAGADRGNWMQTYTGRMFFPTLSALAVTPSTWGYSAHLREVLQRALTAVRTPYAFPADTLAPLNFHGA